MAKIRRFVLDILKPHQPNAVEFACYLADLAADAQFKLTVTAVDKKTENIMLEVAGSDLQFDILSDGIRKQGASIHSIDAVDVDGSPAP